MRAVKYFGRVLKGKKRCPYCNTVKSYSLFYNNSLTRDGYDYDCKECRRKQDQTKQKRKYRVRYRLLQKVAKADKNKSRDALKYAVKKGKILRQPCFFCGERKTQAHHLIYSHPFKVVWVCSSHHAAIHTRERHEHKADFLISPLPAKKKTR